MKSEKTIIKSIALPEQVYRELQEQAKKDFRNETAEIRYIITKYLNEVNKNADSGTKI